MIPIVGLPTWRPHRSDLAKRVAIILPLHQAKGNAAVRPDLKEQRDFLFRAYFGADRDLVGRFVSRAYRDMNRTLRGIQRREDAAEILEGAKEKLRDFLNELVNRRVPTNATELAAAFDQWHRDSCDRLICYYTDLLVPFPFSYGQAQKWINMTFKYYWFFGEEDVSWLHPWFPVAHVPVDDFILRAVANEGVAERPRRTWSSWNDREGYQAFQKTIREYAASRQKIPLALESQWWLRYGSI